MMRILSLTACLLVLSACEGPFILLPGGELTGNVAALPNSWQLNEAAAIAQLETRPEDPYSINFTYVQLNGRLYAYAGDTRTNWVQHIELNPLVRVRVQDTIYPARAVRVSRDDELAEFAAVWVDLSAFQRDPLGSEEVWLYRLEAR